ncbi:hypothetical protein M011DRAFT_163604 [Sporormia fimetaria CBS 119925]|uniref:Zn(2)-C6 fungal-type domain-containing protein n=1 Tax=Sporormia fimetaria CBS 119925 TaxID=1340428 RepID=A0A6A6V4L3_9PLEO|nr:hypothetical protein M011DRAFT_163604 [Sporormia fimetaria CBS 119925]
MPKRSPGCFECRKRKVRCDETRPECTACIRRGTECPGYRPSQSFLLYKSDEDRDQFGLMKEYEDRYMSANQEEYFTLAEATSDCIRRFDDLCGLLQHDTDSQERCLLRHEEVDDQSGRFKIWAGNIGAFQSLPSPGSLEYRLRDAPKIASQLRDLLHDLLNALSNVIDIARGSRPNRRYDPDEDDSEESGSDQGLITWSNKEREPNHHEDPDLHDVPFCRSEAEELFDSLKETIASLFRYSMLIRKASPRDRFEKALSSRDSPFDPSPDIGHVGEKYTHLAQEKKIWLRIRLGKANTQRRQYLRYARDHRTKLSKPATRIQAPVILHASKPMAVPVFALNDPTVAKSEVPSRSTLAPTAASTLLAPEVGLAEENLRDDLSQTSYATSVKEEVNEANLRLPRLTDVNKGKGAFECPLCWTIVDIRKEKAWRKHAFADLRPYVCTFEACNLQLFSTRQDWFNHELEHHRAVWVCHFCKEKSNSPETAKDHLRLQHFQQNVTDDQLNALCDASKRPVKEIAASECPFCTEWESKLRQANPDIAPDEAIVVTPFQYRSHLGSHMQQLALFALPRGYLEDDADALSVASAVAAMGIDRKASNAGSKAGSDISAHSNERAPSLTASEHERIQTFNGAEFAKTLRAKSMPTSEKATDVLVDILPRLLAEEVDELFAHIQINELFEIAYAPWQQPRVLEWLKALCHGRYGSDAFFLTNGILWRWRPSGIFPDLLCQVLSGRTSSERGHIQREFLRLNNGRSLIEMVESQSNVWFAQMLGYIAFNNHVSDPSIIVALEDIKQAIDESRSDNQLPKDGLIVGNALQRTPTGTRRILGTCRPSDLMIRSADLGRVS